jgi:hypothetical protein
LLVLVLLLFRAHKYTFSNFQLKELQVVNLVQVGKHNCYRKILFVSNFPLKE